MASPQESITTVSGRRCTRSRARTAVTSILTSSEAAVVTPTPSAISSTTLQPPPPPPAVTSSVQAPLPLPPSLPPSSSAAAAPPLSSAAAEQPVAAPTTTQAAAASSSSSAIGTISVAPTPCTPTSLLETLLPSRAAVAVPQRPVQVNRPAAVAGASSIAEASTPTPIISVAAIQDLTPLSLTLSTPTISNTLSTAILPPLRDQSSLLPSLIAPGVVESAVLPSSLVVDPNPQPSQINSPPAPTSANVPIAALPQPTTTASITPTGDAAAGVIGEGPGTQPSDRGRPSVPPSGNANLGGIVGGVVGGVAGLALLCALLFICLRKRKSRQSKWAEKSVENPHFMDKMKAKAAGVGIMFAKVKGSKKGPTGNPYQRHSQQDSISSVLSTTETQGFYASGDKKRSSSGNSERNRLRKKNSSVSSQSTFAEILEEHKNSANNPFADPTPEPPRTLRLSNPDASPRGPLTPQPAVTSDRAGQNPFASAFDAPDPLLPVSGHTRTQSQASARSSNPTSFRFPAKSTRSISISKATGIPPPSNQGPNPSHARQSSMALSKFDATSATACGDCEYFGEPGPSRPATGLFTPCLPTGRTIRQSDPFDLDRPEVLHFGSALSCNEVRCSVIQPNTVNRRTSTTGNWSGAKDAAAGPFSWNTTPRR